MMNAKLQVLFFTLVLLASMVSVSESFAGNKVGRKRSTVREMEVRIFMETKPAGAKLGHPSTPLVTPLI